MELISDEKLQEWYKYGVSVLVAKSCEAARQLKEATKMYIDPLKAYLSELKDKIHSEMISEGIKTFESDEGQATRVHTESAELDIENYLKEIGIDPALEKKHSRVEVIFDKAWYIKERESIHGVDEEIKNKYIKKKDVDYVLVTPKKKKWVS